MDYKILDSVLLERLKSTGAEDRIWETQFGFKSKSGTLDALFLTRRLVDEVWAGKDSQIIFAALDWSKAFDTISPERLAYALYRFGVPDKFIRMIKSIYSGRQFLVSDFGRQSELHSQAFGISQGCPLSPFLFVIVISILMYDARDELKAQGCELSEKLLVHDLLYADDTLLIDVYGPNLQQYMDIVVRLGAFYGLSINWNKVEVMPIQCDVKIRGASGSFLESKSSLAYLGATIHQNGSIDSELCRRLGMASQEFKALCAVWNHTNFGYLEKFAIFRACVCSKLLYGLQSAWLTKA